MYLPTTLARADSSELVNDAMLDGIDGNGFTYEISDERIVDAIPKAMKIGRTDK